MRLNNFVLLAGNTTRSKAYLQLLVKAGLYPSFCILFAAEKDGWKKEWGGNSRKIETCQTKYFDREESLIVTLEKNQIDYQMIEEQNVNAAAMVALLQSLKQKYMIYSGYGGTILKKELFCIGKKFLHIHAGKLPQYRGSTTAYYSMLQDNRISSTAIFLNEKIDEGEMILSESFEIPLDGVDIDYIFEPYTRAVVLVDTIKRYYENGEQFITQSQKEEEAETYFIIHPVLKHLALMRLER